MHAWDEGFKAGMKGEELSKNPYPYGSKDAFDWKAGWKDYDDHARNRDKALDSLGWFG